MFMCVVVDVQCMHEIVGKRGFSWYDFEMHVYLSFRGDFDELYVCIELRNHLNAL